MPLSLRRDEASHREVTWRCNASNKSKPISQQSSRYEAAAALALARRCGPDGGTATIRPPSSKPLRIEAMESLVFGCCKQKVWKRSHLGEAKGAGINVF